MGEHQEEAVIPGPTPLPLIGNAGEFDLEFPLGTLLRLADTYGPIYQLTTRGQRMIIVGNQELMNEISDEKRFGKVVGGALGEVRNGVHDGLFTAHAPQEENWGIAHRVLIPAFGPMSIRGMFDQMHDIASQLLMKWARHGPEHKIDVADDFTRLALDTLALCSMNYRFNSYYRDEQHPFVEAMGNFLTESGNRARRPGFMALFYREADKQYWKDIEVMQKTAGDVVQARKAQPTDRNDLLNAMLKGVDSKTGKKLTDQGITDNLITFLIAGHETTSGMLSYAFHYLCKNPEAYRKAQEEVDRVVGTGPVTVDHLTKLPYINALLRETLRLASNINAIGFGAHKDEVIGGKYPVKKSDFVVALLSQVHLDPKVYGEDANEWKPERMLDENFERLQREFPNCWKPFGNGMRACIGRPFAWQEALLVVTLLLQNFNFTPDDPGYVLAHKQTLTIKPKGFYMHASLRHGLTPTELERHLHIDSSAMPQASAISKVNGNAKAEVSAGKQISIYYGSNTGTCEALAQRLATDAPRHGFQARVVASLDNAKEKLPKNEPVTILTASYEGQPPDNAGHFVAWLEGLKGSELEGVNYSVFGCGHHDWAATFQRIPTLVDDLLEQRGGKRIAAIGQADAAAGDMFTDFESWEDNVFWPAMKKKFNTSSPSADSVEVPSLNVEVSAPRTSTLRQDVNEARVIDTRVLTAPGEPEKRHIEIELPSDMTYKAGDYLAILPLNPKDTVARAMRYFGLAWDSVLTLSSSTNSLSTLPISHPVPAADLFGAYVELSQPASRRNIQALLAATTDEGTKSELERLSGDAFSSEITAKRTSVLTLLERFRTTLKLPLAHFLPLLPPMRVRQYSISSSPLSSPTTVTLTYAVLDSPSLSGEGRHLGVASSYLSSLSPEDRLHVSVRPSNTAFHLPASPEEIPILMIAAGTGLAPFRAFIQERALQIAAGRTLAPAVLFLGCRHPERDSLYASELAEWEKAGAVSLRYAFSQSPTSPSAAGCKYVQDRFWKDREEVKELWEKGAKVFVCGSRELGEGVKKTSIEIMREWVKEKKDKDVSEEDAEAWFEKIRNERYATDVFA